MHRRFYLQHINNDAQTFGHMGNHRGAGRTGNTIAGTGPKPKIKIALKITLITSDTE